jgi:hypothetical protein
MTDFEIALYAVTMGWFFGFTSYALIESFRIMKEIKARNR